MLMTKYKIIDLNVYNEWKFVRVVRVNGLFI